MSTAKGSTLGFAPAVIIGKAQPKPKPEVKIAEATFSVQGEGKIGGDDNKNQEGQTNDNS